MTEPIGSCRSIRMALDRVRVATRHGSEAHAFRTIEAFDMCLSCAHR
jgi:hypothetical protein